MINLMIEFSSPVITAITISKVRAYYCNSFLHNTFLQNLVFRQHVVHANIFSFLIFSETKKRRKDPSESTTEEDNGAPECKGKRKKIFTK